MQEIMTAVAFAAVAAGSFTDVKVHEVPDWLNYGLLAFGIGANALLSIALWTWTYLAYSLLGLLVFFAIAHLMFYAGQWGGGDSKMLLALGAVFGLPFSLSAPFADFSSFLVSFWFNLLVAGVFYALAWSVFLAAKNRKKFLKEAGAAMGRNVRARRAALAFSVLLLASALFFRGSPAALVLAAASFLAVVSVYLSLFSKAVERAGMLRFVKPSELTEGDWIAKDILLNGKLFLRKRTIDSESMDKLKTFYNAIDKKIKIKRRYFLFIKLVRNVNLSKIKMGDILEEQMKLESYFFKKNKKIEKSTHEQINIYLRKNSLFDVKIKRKTLFFWQTKTISPMELKSGDVLLQTVEMGYYVSGPKDLGIEKYQIEWLKQLGEGGNVNLVLIKVGIPFVPSFLIALMATIAFGNLLMALLRHV